MIEVNINTDTGNLELTPATANELMSIAGQWPMGLSFSQAETEPNGLVFQVGEQEAYGIKLQPPDTNEPTARALHFHNLALIASALPFYLEHRHQGIMLPCSYYREKTDGRVESGLAFFAAPHPAAKGLIADREGFQYDHSLGEGASKMIYDMVVAISEGSKRVDLPLNRVIGIDLRPRLALGGLGMPFLVQGAKVFAIQHPLRKEHPVWAFAVRAGFSKLPYAPLIPAAVPGPPGAPHGWLDRVKILLQR